MLPCANPLMPSKSLPLSAPEPGPEPGVAGGSGRPFAMAMAPRALPVPGAAPGQAQVTGAAVPPGPPVPSSGEAAPARTRRSSP